ncbi:MAG TPA: CheB methylesterase domain-containing protein, partial [Solirubrobacteraceae bacterium]|nr:CheB methylesterase domain-containing protein [Solirubrobacteraceae bacterium]
QHMPPNFTASLAARLDAASRLTIREAADGERPSPGVALLAPGGRHMRLHGGRVELSDEPPIGALRPRADLTIADVAREHGRHTILVVLTGMGSDGLEGARAVRAAGGRVIVEDESTCTVFGMPRAIESAGLADVVAPLHEIAGVLIEEAA